MRGRNIEHSVFQNKADPVWELACLRKRSISQHIPWLTHRHRGQAGAHMGGRVQLTLSRSNKLYHATPAPI